MSDLETIIRRVDRSMRARAIAWRVLMIALPTLQLSVGLLAVLMLTGWCTSTLQRGCDPMPKWRGYVLEFTR